MFLQEKTRAAAAPRKPKKGAVSSPLNADDILIPPKMYRSVYRNLGILKVNWIRGREMDAVVAQGSFRCDCGPSQANAKGDTWCGP